MSTHKCPRRGCPEFVSDRLFACYPHWFELPADVQAYIRVTARQSILSPSRREALSRARTAWEALG